MIIIQTCIYTLPEISFIGGETQEFTIRLKDQNGSAVNMTGASADLSICDYSNKTGKPLLSYPLSLIADEGGNESILYTTIPKEDTAKLFGKFIYQITVIDADGNSEIPSQGIMNIFKNIHQSYILDN